MGENADNAGPRHSRRFSVGDRVVEIASGYDARGDRWAYHAYLVRDGDRLEKLHEVTGGEATLEAAFKSAETEARAIVRFRFGGNASIGSY